MTADRQLADDWVARNSRAWVTTDDRLQGIRKQRKAEPDEALGLARDYRRLARDWSLSRQLDAPSSTSSYLGRLYNEVHLQLNKKPTRFLDDLQRLFTESVPRAVSGLLPQLSFVVALFVFSVLAGWWLISTYPDTISLVASASMIEDVRSGKLWTDDLLNVLPSSVLAIDILTNNVSVSIIACAIGAFYGIGTVYIIGLNGFMLGAVFAFTAQYGMAGRLFEFVVSHGIVELSVIMLAGAIGMSLGNALVNPGPYSRRFAFEAAARSAASVLVACIAFLIGAAFIEGYVSPNPSFSLAARIVIGLAYMVLFVVVVTGLVSRGRRN